MLSGICLGDEFSHFVSKTDKDIRKKAVPLQRISLSILYFELLRRGGEVYAGRTDAGEVDFVVMKHNGEREYYQVAYTANDEKTLNRELSSLRKIKDTYPKYLLTTDFDSANIDGIRKINVIDWLLGKE